MSLEQIKLPVNGLDDRDAFAIDPEHAPNLRNVRADEEKIVRGPGAVEFAAEPTLASGFGFRVGAIAAPAATGSQTITHNLGATPVGLIVFGSLTRLTGTVTDDLRWTFGFTNGTTTRQVGMSSEDAKATSNTGRRRSASIIAVPTFAGGGVLAEATFTSWTSTSFTINWTTVTGTASEGLTFIIFGGGSIAANVLQWNTGTSTGNVAVTGAGFQPNTVIHIHAGPGTTSPDTATHGHFGIGAMTASDQWAHAVSSQDAQGNTTTKRWRRSDACLIGMTNAGAEDFQGARQSLDADGFTVNFSNAPASNTTIYSLVLAGISTNLGIFEAASGTEPFLQEETGIGFVPQVLFMVGNANDSPESHGIIRMGAGDGTTQGVHDVWDRDNVTTSETARVRDNRFVWTVQAPDTTDQAAQLFSFDSDGFTLNWIERNSAIYPTTTIPYWAAALSSITSAGTVRNLPQAWFAGTTERILMLTHTTAFVYNSATGVFDGTAEAYAGMTATQRFGIANTLDTLAYSARGLTVGGAQTIRAYDGTSFSNLITTGTNHSANILLAFNDRIVSADVNVAGVVNPTQARWCVNGNVNDWSGAGSGTLEIIETSNAPLTGGFVLGERAYFTKAREIIELIATGSLTPVFRQETKVSGVGCIARHSIAQGDNFMFFLGPDSVYYFDGSNLRDVGRATQSGTPRSVMRQLKPLIDYNNTDEIQGVVLAAASEYWLQVGTDIFVYDYLRDRWFRDQQSSISAMGVIRVGNQVTTDIDASEFMLVAGPSRLTWRVDPSLNTFRGEPFNAYFETKDFQAQRQFFVQGGVVNRPALGEMNSLYRVDFRTDADAVVEVGVSIDRGSTWETEEVTANGHGYGAFFIEKAFEHVRFRFRSDDATDFAILAFAQVEFEGSGVAYPGTLA